MQTELFSTTTAETRDPQASGTPAGTLPGPSTGPPFARDRCSFCGRGIGSADRYWYLEGSPLTSCDPCQCRAQLEGRVGT